MSATTTLRMVLLGEDKSASKALKGVGDQSDKTAKKMGTFHKVGTAAGVALAGGALLAGKAMFEMTKKAAEDQQAASRLAQTLHTAAGATKTQTAAVEDWITAQGKASGFSDDELRPSLSKLVTATHDVGKAQKLASLAMDISVGTGRSLESVSFALAKAQNGQVSGLSRLGVKTTKTTGDTMALEKAQTAVKSAQLSYTAAVKAHGKSSAEASIASDKLKQAEENVGAAREKTKKTTLSLDQITKNLASTYGGAAAKNAETAAGKQKIMAVQFQELQEQIGTALIPVMSQLMTVGLSVVGWISNNTRVAGILVGVLGSLAAVTWAVSAATKAYFAITKLAAAAQIIWTNAVFAFNIAMALNPVGVIVLGIIALIAVFVLAYKKIGWFRDGVNAAFHGIMAVVGAVVGFVKAHWAPLFAILGGPIGLAAVVIIKNFDKVKAGIQVLGKWATWLWNNAFQPALKFIVQGIGFMVGIWGKMLSALGHVPGFGWAKDAGQALQNAADKANNVANAIGKIPDHKDFSFNIYTHHIGRPGASDPSIPALAKGGIVHRPTLALIGEAGPEAVVPLSKSGGVGRGGNIHIHISGLVPSDEDAVVRKIHSGLRKLKAQGFSGQPLGLA